MLSGRGLCDGLVSRPEDSYQLWCVVECDLETSRMRRPSPTGGLLRQKKMYHVTCLVNTSNEIGAAEIRYKHKDE